MHIIKMIQLIELKLKENYCSKRG